MRGYILIHDDGRLQGAWASQGHVSEVQQDKFSFGEALPRVAVNLTPGLYRAAYTTGKLSGRIIRRIKPGRRVASAVREAARLRKKAEEQSLYASSGMPGIAMPGRSGYGRGTTYQHMADMTMQRMRNTKNESRALARWLIDTGYP